MVILYYGGLFAHRPRSAISLERLLEDYFEVPIRVLQFQGQWLRLDPDSQSQVGDEGGNARLGMNVVIGERVWDVRSKIRIRMGPLTNQRFVSFIPDQSAVPDRKDFFKLMHLVRLYVGPEIKVDVQLVLKASEIPKCRMHHTPSSGPRLGWNSWLTCQPIVEDSGDAVFAGEAITWLPESKTKPPR